MSKKTRKKSPKRSSKTVAKPSAGKTSSGNAKTPSGKAARAKPATSAKTAASKTRKVAASKPAKSAKKQLGKAIPKATTKASPKAASKAASKPLKTVASKPSGPGVTAPRAPAKAMTAKPEPAKPPVPKAVDEKASAPTAAKSVLAEGAKAPAFRLPRDGGDTVSLTDYAGKKLVLFFYPRADTPGCTKEAIDFTRLASTFAQDRTAVLGVSADPIKAQEAFRNKHQLTTPLVSDEQHAMLEAYGAWGEKSMYGRTFQGVLRTTVLIGADGRVIRIWRHVKVDGHADEVLAAVRALI
jgi:thioredoxin-dependent peroxiredoxin